MRNWYRRSLKFRLASWFALVSCVILLGLAPVVYGLIQHRLYEEADRQLRIDWELVAAHLGRDPAGGVRWLKRSPATPESPAYASTRFEVWSGSVKLLAHAPEPGMQISVAPQPSGPAVRPPRTVILAEGARLRVWERPVTIGGEEMILRIFRDVSELYHTLSEILWSFALGAPLAALLSALGGYVMARRMLQPLDAMAEQAQRISSDSLSERLPNPNPHDELGRLAEVFNHTLERLEKSFESLKRFTADASHELRTPLTALRTVGEVALRESSDASLARETIVSMLEEARHLENLTEVLLLLARLEGRQFPVSRQEVSIAQLAEEVSDSIAVLAEQKGQRLESVVKGTPVARTDPVLLRQALWNLLHNAIRHSGRDTTVRLRCCAEADGVVLEVTDEGPGIAPEHQEKIFERFYRIDQARTRNDGGAGLGLAIAKFAVERLGGRIELISEIGRGSCFRLILPASDAT